MEDHDGGGVGGWAGGGDGGVCSSSSNRSSKRRRTSSVGRTDGGGGGKGDAGTAGEASGAHVRSKGAPGPAPGAAAAASTGGAAAALLTQAIKRCRTPHELAQLLHTGGLDKHPAAPAEPVAVAVAAAAGAGGPNRSSNQPNGSFNHLNDLHLVAALTHLAQLHDSGGHGGGSTSAGTPSDGGIGWASEGIGATHTGTVQRLGWDLAMEIGRRAAVAAAATTKGAVTPRLERSLLRSRTRSNSRSPTRGDGGGGGDGGDVHTQARSPSGQARGQNQGQGVSVLAQPRGASNAMWAAAKLGLRLRAAWWEALAAPLLAATATAAEGGKGRRSGGGGGDGGTGAGRGGRGTGAAGVASGRDVCNALYALGLAAAAAAGEEGGAARRFRGWLAALGEQLLRGCTAQRLRVGGVCGAHVLVVVRLELGITGSG